jgi:hypothetical protein
MGFIQGVTAGAAIRDRNRDLYRPTNPALSYAAITQEPQAMRGHNQLGTPPEEQPMGMNPSAIHRRAAEMVLQEKEMDLQKTALEVEKLKEANAMAKDTRRRAIEQEPFDRQKQIDEEYGRGMARAKDWQGAQDRQAAAQKDTQRQAYKQAMAGLFMGNGEAMKDYINQFGDPKTNVEDVFMSPDGSGQVVIRPAPDKDGNRKKDMAFDSLEQFHRGFGLWVDPDSAEKIKQAKGSGDAETKLSPKDAAKMSNDAKKNYIDSLNLVPGKELSSEQRKEMEAIGAKAIKEAEAQSRAVNEKKGAIKGPKAVGGKTTVTKGTKPQDVPGAKLSPKDGNYYIPDPDRKGKYILLEPEGTSIATEKSKTPAGGERVKGKMPEKDGGAIAKGKVKKKSVGTTTFTDKKTGEKVNRTYYADGSFDEERQQIH